ncbi:unnamed protein product [Brachionus calyciflorus]|uniref:Uncharacterized protein n=1 Tax=Brachionus calyciflorus TaxID=104777 RepID=A0A814D6Z9_9BILA|nr:unnamed protein product [Brachionus calyciflorus]
MKYTKIINIQTLLKISYGKYSAFILGEDSSENLHLEMDKTTTSNHFHSIKTINTDKTNIQDAVKSLNIKNVIEIVAEIWDSMPGDFLRSKRFGLDFNDFELSEWLNNDFDDPGYYMLSDNEIIQETKALFSSQEPKMIDEESDHENEPIEKKKEISNGTAELLVDGLIQYCNENDIDSNINCKLFFE